MPPQDAPRRLAAVWFADVVGYTALSSRDEDGAIRVIGAFQEISRDLAEEHGGRVVKFIGDAVLAEFPSTDAAVRSALTLVDRFADHTAVRPYVVTLRVGVHVGEVISADDGDIYGDGVNLASRLEGAAAPGRVFVSEAVHAQIQQRQVFEARAVGTRTLKGFARPVDVYEVAFRGALKEPLVAPGPPRDRTGQPYWPRSRAIAMGLTVAIFAFGTLAVWNAFRPAEGTAVGGATYAAQQITFTGTAGAPRFSPDGNRVAVIQDPGLYGGDLLILSREGSADRHVAANVSAFGWADDEALVWANPNVGGTYVGVDLTSADTVSRDAWFDFEVDAGSRAVTRIVDGVDRSYVVREPLDGGVVDTVLGTSRGERVREVAWSPDGGWLAASLTDADGRWSLRAFSLDSAFTTPLLPQRVTSPRWSPDGTSIYFIGEVERQRGVHALQIDTERGEAVGAVRHVLAGDIEAFDVAVDGSIVYSLNRRRANVWSMSVDGGAEPVQATRGTAPVSSPALDPGGERLAFVRNGDLHVADVDGGNPRQLTRLSAEISAVRWSPDGAYLAFIVQAPARRILMIVGLEGGEPRQIELENPLPYDLEPVLAWIGVNAVVYVGADEQGWPNVLSRVDMLSLVDRTLIAPDTTSPRAFLGIATSPDGSRAVAADATGELLLLSVGDSAVESVYPEVPGRPQLWTDDGRLVLRSLIDDRELWSVATDGTGAELIVRLPLPCTSITLDGSARRAACTVLESLERDVWIARPESRE